MRLDGAKPEAIARHDSSVEGQGAWPIDTGERGRHPDMAFAPCHLPLRKRQIL